MAPWNAPICLALMCAIPAIAAGNTVIFKTSESSPGSQLITAELMKEVDHVQHVFSSR